jgi:esterase/lipase
MNGFGSRDKTLAIYEKAIHRVVQNAAADIAIPDIINWLKARAGGR